jgi:DNA-binding NarL/FixJ family response regulator
VPNAIAPPDPIRVLIADDQRVVRDGLSMLVGLIDGVEVVGSAGDGAEAVRLAASQRPHVVLMDLRMPILDGAAATAQIRSELPDTQVVVLTTYADDASLFPALQAGARGYLTKDADAEEIERAIRAVHAGHAHLQSAVQQRLIDATTGATPANAADEQAQGVSRVAGEPPDGLTAREVEVLGLIAAGLSNGEIAERLVLSAATVKTHINRIFSKTGARDRAQAVRYAYRAGLADRDVR